MNINGVSCEQNYVGTCYQICRYVLTQRGGLYEWSDAEDELVDQGFTKYLYEIFGEYTLDENKDYPAEIVASDVKNVIKICNKLEIPYIGTFKRFNWKPVPLKKQHFKFVFGDQHQDQPEQMDQASS